MQRHAERTVAYIRASSDQQMAASPSRQKADCRAIAKRFELPPIEDDAFYAEDKGRSGLKRENRTALAQMILDAEDGKFNAVIIAETSRLSREEFLDQADLWKRIRDTGVRLYTSFGEVDFTDTGAVLQMVIHAQQAHQEAKTLAFRTTSGKRAKLALEDASREPEYLNGLVPGYMKQFHIGGKLVHVARYSDPARSYIKPKGAICRIVPTDNVKELKAVKAMFQALADGQNSREAADVFNSFGMRTPDGNPWIPTLVRKLARKREYIGECLVGQYYGKKKGQFASITPEPTIIENICPAIIDRATWDEAQRTLDILKGNPGRQSREPKYLLSGLVYSEAGLPMYGRVCAGDVSYIEWKNPKLKPTLAKDHKMLSIRCKYLDGAVLNLLKGILSDPEAMREVEESILEELRSVEAVADPTAAELQSVRETIERATKRIVLVEDDGAITAINAEIRRLRAREKELRQSHDRTKERGQRTLSVRNALAQLPALLDSPAPELGNVLSAIIDRIVVSRAGAGWSAEIQLMEGEILPLEDRDICGEMVCHKVADFIEERGQVTTEEITEAFGIRSRSVSGVIKRAISRGRAIEKVGKGVYTSAADSRSDYTAWTKNTLITFASQLIPELRTA